MSNTKPPGKEQEIEIHVNGDYKNIYPKKELEVGNYIIVNKSQFDEAGPEREGKFGPYHNATVEYKGEEVSISFLKPKYAEEYNAAGGLGDDVYVWLDKESFVNKKTDMEMVYKRLYFAPVEQ